MKSRVLKSSIVLGILVLFIGSNIIPSTIGINREKTTITTLGSRGYVQGLIDNASAGDTIYIPSGMYYENIIINKSISLIGEDKNTTIIDGNWSGDVVTISADWVNISGFTIINGESGIFITSNNSIITDNIITTNHNNGIHLLGDFYGPSPTNNLIAGNTIISNIENGISLDIYSRKNTISENIIINNGNGIFSMSDDNIISKNIIISNNMYGICLTRWWYGGCRNNTVIGNILNDNGIFLYDVYEIMLERNLISNCDCGVLLDWSCDDILLSNNSFINTGLELGDIGSGLHMCCLNNTVNGKPLVYLEYESNVNITNAGQIFLMSCNNITVYNQDLSNTSTGIRLDGTQNCRIINNSLRSNKKDGIHLSSSSNNTISSNTISNNVNGIYVIWSNYNRISNNVLVDNDRGISEYLGGSENKDNHFISNNISNNDYSVYLDYGSHSNSILGNTFSNNNYGLLIGSSCNNIINNSFFSHKMSGIEVYGDYNSIQDNTVMYSYTGIQLSIADNNNVTGNTVMNSNKGIQLSYADNNNVTGNNISNNIEGIIIVGSGNHISNNIITSNDQGIHLGYADISFDNTITSNDISNNIEGIIIVGSGNHISNNIITSNDQGIHLGYADNNTITSNDISNNIDGIKITGPRNNNNVIGNNISLNSNLAIYIEESNMNNISENNFIDNNKYAYFIDCKNIWTHNYWNRPRILPKLIIGKTVVRNIQIPWFDVDWRPALKPYDIP